MPSPGPSACRCRPPTRCRDAQRAAAQALIDGPRKAVFGPFVPLLHSPVLMERIGSLGEYLRFDSVLDARVRELVTCAVARHVGNQFEWVMHAPAAVKAGVSADAIEALRLGRRAAPLAEDEQIALDFAQELLQHHGVSEPTYAAAEARFGEQARGRAQRAGRLLRDGLLGHERGAHAGAGRRRAARAGSVSALSACFRASAARVQPARVHTTFTRRRLRMR